MKKETSAVFIQPTDDSIERDKLIEAEKKAKKRIEVEEQRKHMREEMKKRKKEAVDSGADRFDVQIFTSAGKAEAQYDLASGVDKIDQSGVSGRKLSKPDYLEIRHSHSQSESTEVDSMNIKYHQKTHSVEHESNSHSKKELVELDMPIRKASNFAKQKKPIKSVNTQIQQLDESNPKSTDKLVPLVKLDDVEYDSKQSGSNT